jgi:hypothetical protein
LARTDGHSVGPTLLLKKGKVEALMKGSLRTDELMGAVEPAIPASGPTDGSATASSWMRQVMRIR